MVYGYRAKPPITIRWVLLCPGNGRRLSRQYPTRQDHPTHALSPQRRKPGICLTPTYTRTAISTLTIMPTISTMSTTATMPAYTPVSTSTPLPVELSTTQPVDVSTTPTPTSPTTNSVGKVSFLPILLALAFILLALGGSAYWIKKLTQL